MKPTRRAKPYPRETTQAPDGTLYEWHAFGCHDVSTPHWHSLGFEADPYIEEATANPERVNNGTMIYKRPA